MGYWGWRPLVLFGFISVMVVGCSVTSPITSPATPTEYPPVTLTVRRASSPTPTDTIVTPLVPTTTLDVPTSTPTATSTPIVYTVRDGDTLLGIAISFGVDVGDLQAANDNIDARSLQIGQQLIIPPRTAATDESPSAESNLLPTATPQALAVQPPTCYPTQGDRVTCLGEIPNTLSIPLERIVIAVQLRNADGTEEIIAAIEQRILPLGGTAPYRAQFPANPERGNYSVGAVLISADEAKNIDQRFVLLQVSEESALYESGRYIVAARVRNADNVSAVAVRATLTVRGGDGHVLGYRVVQILDTLPAGADAPVRVEVMPQTSSEVITHTLYVEAQRGE